MMKKQTLKGFEKHYAPQHLNKINPMFYPLQFNQFRNLAKNLAGNKDALKAAKRTLDTSSWTKHFKKFHQASEKPDPSIQLFQEIKAANQLQPPSLRFQMDRFSTSSLALSKLAQTIVEENKNQKAEAKRKGKGKGKAVKNNVFITESVIQRFSNNLIDQINPGSSDEIFLNWENPNFSDQDRQIAQDTAESPNSQIVSLKSRAGSEASLIFTPRRSPPPIPIQDRARLTPRRSPPPPPKQSRATFIPKRPPPPVPTQGRTTFIPKRPPPSPPKQRANPILTSKKLPPLPPSRDKPFISS